MAGVNAYTKTVDNVYKPRTLQELMIAPAYKREKHDELDASIAQYETALAQADALDVHSGALEGEQKKLYDKMIQQRDKLNAEGFSQSSKSDFMRFNKEYQQSIGPRGTIGKAMSAKKSYGEQKAMLIDLAAKMGHDPQASLKQLDKQFNDYVSKYNETKQIKDFVATLPPQYQDLAKDIQIEKQLLGHQIKTSKGNEDYDISVDTKTGMFVAKTQSGQIITMDNKDAIGESLKKLNTKWLEEDGAGYKSAQWNMMDMENVADYITSSLKSMSIKEVKDTRETNYQFIQPRANSGSETGNIYKDSYSNSGQTLPIGYNATQIRNNAEQVLGNPEADGRDTAKAREYRRVLDNTQQQLLNTDPQYQQAQTQIDAARSDERIAKIYNPEIQDILRNATSLNAPAGFGLFSGSAGFDYTMPDGTSGNISIVDGTINPQDIETARNIIKDHNVSAAMQLQDTKINQLLVSKGFERTDIDVPFDKTSESSIQILNSIKSLNDDSIIPGQVIYIDDAGRNKTIDMDEPSKASVMNLFQNADASDIKGVKLSAMAGQAGYTIRFTPKDGSAIKPSGWFNNKSFSGKESIEMFLPITKLADPVTGLRHTSTMVLDRLPIEPPLKDEFRKLITTTDISYTDNEDELGQSNISAASYFGEANPDWRLDVLRNEGENGNTYTPFLIDVKGNKEPIRWGSFLPSTLDETKEEIPLDEAQTLQRLTASNLVGIAIQSAAINHRDVYDRYQLGTDNPNTYGFLAWLRTANANVELTNPKDIYYFSKYRNNGAR